MSRNLNSIVVKLAILIFAFIILFSAPLYLISSKALISDYENLIDEKNAEKVYKMKDVLEKEMFQIETVVNSFSSLIELTYNERVDDETLYEEKLIKIFSGYLGSERASSYSIYTYFEPSSEEDVLDIWLTFQEDTIMRHDQIPYERYVQKDNMSFFYDVKDQENAHWVKPYRNRYNEYITSYVKPLYHDEKFIGIVGMYLDIDKLRHLMMPLNIDNNTYYWVFNSEYEIIYHPFLQEGADVEFEYSYKNPPLYIESEIDSNLYRHYISSSHNNWTYVLSINEDTLLESRFSILRRILLSYTLFLILLVIIIIVIIKRYIIKIIEVIEALKKAQSGNYADVIQVTGNDEIGLLAHTTNEVLDKIGDKILKLEHLAYNNSHTGLPNLEKLKHDLKLYSNQEMALYLLDLDNFRIINDILGKNKSNAFIKEISRKLKEAEDRNLFVYHTSDDEFAFLEFDPDIGDISTNAEYIINLFSQLAYSSKYQINISTSIGVSKYPDDVGISGGLIECARIALETAKNEGKDNFKMFSRFIPQKEYERANIYHDIRQAISNNKFILHYQNIYNRNKQCIAAEALVRWEHPEEGIMYPAQFLSHIEMSGLNHEFGQTILKQICKDYTQMKAAKTAPKQISMNLSHRQLLNPLFISNTLSIIRNESLTPDFLAIEITDEILKYDLHTSKKKLDALKVLGITIEIDDFGSGNASLNILSKLPLSKVKIDGSIISQIKKSDHIYNMVHGLIQMCHQMNYIVIAECVEDEPTFKALMDMKCDQFQGFYLHKPKHISERSMES